jgi:hypothetical protein
MAIISFYVSLILIISFFGIKLFEVKHNEKHAFSKILSKGDDYCHDTIKKSRKVFSKIKFKNFQKLYFIILNWIKKEMVYLKRRFDSKQPRFFLSPVTKHDIHKKGSVSFFLKNVSEYKESLKDREL